MFRRLVTLAGLGLVGAVLSQDKTGLLPTVKGVSTMTIDAVNSGSGTTELDSSIGTGAAFFGYATASSGITYGVYGQSSSTSGIGVEGSATAGSGFAYGVVGASSSTDGVGVYGFTGGGSGSTYAVKGLSTSTNGTGVFGYADASSGVTYGVFGRSDSTSGTGLFGVVSSASGVPIIAKGASGQSANLQEWRNSSNTVLSKVLGNASGIAPAGAMLAPQLGQNSPNVSYTSPSNPASFTNAMNVSGSAMQADGLAILFTPKLTGNVLVTAAVDLFSTNPAFGTFAAVWYGTGTAPSFGATLPAGGVLVPPYRGSGYNPTALFPVFIPGLTVGTQYWFDLGHAVNAGGNGSHFNIAYTIIEI